MDGWPIVGLAWAVPAAVAAAWGLVRSGRASVWTAMTPTLAVLGALALAAGGLRAGGEVGVAAALAAGAGAGAGLYAATAAFMRAARGWRLLARQTADLYRRRRGYSLAAALALAVVVTATGEELAWRGTVQGVLAGRLGGLEGAALAWAVYVGANAVSGSLPVVLGAAVGGAAWGGLALWTGGVVASVACHAVWTGLMVALPPVFSREGRDPSRGILPLGGRP